MVVDSGYGAYLVPILRGARRSYWPITPYQTAFSRDCRLHCGDGRRGSHFDGRAATRSSENPILEAVFIGELRGLRRAISPITSSHFWCFYRDCIGSCAHFRHHGRLGKE